MQINRWLNKTEVKIDEVRIGNMFSYSTCNEAIITGIHQSGQVEFVDSVSGNVFQNETISTLRPIRLDYLYNYSIIQDYLKHSGFVWTKSICAEVQGIDFEILLKNEVLKDRWALYYKTREASYERSVFFFHEVQNAYYFFTGKELKVK